MPSKLLWKIENASADMIPDLKTLCGQDGGVLMQAAEGADRFTLSCLLPQTSPGAGTGTGDTVTGGPAADGRMVIAVTERDVDALARVAQSEVGHFGKYGADQLSGGVKAVVDTIFNRVAHKHFPLHGGPRTIEGVINDPSQFSAINPLGTWEKLPEASAAVLMIVRDHVIARAAGQASTIDGATHFLNPHLSSPSAMTEWGQFVVDNAIAVFGNEAKKDVHYHGFPPNAIKPDPYRIAFRNDASDFNEAGVSPGGPPALKDMREKIRSLCQAEFAFFENGTKKETDDPQFRRIGEYWGTIGLAFDGRTKIPDSQGNLVNPAWSSVFVSWILKQAGAGNRFKYAQAHSIYFQSFVGAPANSLYEALPPDAEPVDVGDIIHCGREFAKQFTFAEARARFIADASYPSHSDIVVAVDRDKKQVTTIGGNVSNAVNEKTIKIDKDGKLVDRTEGGQKVPWIGILKLRG